MGVSGSLLKEKDHDNPKLQQIWESLLMKLSKPCQTMPIGWRYYRRLTAVCAQAPQFVDFNNLGGGTAPEEEDRADEFFNVDMESGER